MSTAGTLTPSELVGKYIQLRNKKDEIKERHSKELAPYNDAMDMLESKVLDHLITSGVESMRTGEGTVYRSVRTTYKVNDFTEFSDFVKVHNRFDMLERRCAKPAVEEYLSEHGTLPPGLSTYSEAVVGFRKK